MENNEKKVEEPSVEELTRFYTIEQAKQELESFAKEDYLIQRFHSTTIVETFTLTQKIIHYP